MQRSRVLIVDDQRDVRRMLRAALETLGAGISVTDVPSGEEAILVISRQPVDLLISDVRLPGISGLELIERTRVRNPELHLILITGMTDDATRRQLDHALADAYFYKPIQIGEFLDVVQDLLEIKPAKPAPPEIAGERKEPPAPPTPEILPAVWPAPPGLVIDLPPVVVPPVEVGPTQPAETHAPIELPSQRILAELRDKLEATLAALVNRQGDALDLSGEIAAEIDEWVAVLRLTAGVVESGSEHARTLIFTPGSRMDFWVTPVATGTALVVGAPHPAWHRWDFGELTAVLLSASVELRTVADADVLALAADLAAAEQPAADDALQSLDALFETIQTHDIKNVDVDAFWDLAAEDHSVPSEREGGMTYDEARRLGLAPDEE